MESQTENLRKVQTIIAADYSEYPNPLRELLEYRRTVYLYVEPIEASDALIEYCEKQIKQLLVL